MKIKLGFMLRPIADTFVVVPIGAASINFNGMINLNETGAFLWRELEKEVTKEELVEKLTQEYDVDQRTADAHVDKFLVKLKEADLIEC